MKTMNRREFFRQGARGAAGVAMGVAAIRTKQSAYGANDQINVAVVGVHGQGRSHVGSLCGIDGVRVIALCDPDRRVFGPPAQTVKNKYGTEPELYVDIRDLLADKDLDAISIATTNHWHALATVWGCQAGKDVYVEKPASWCVWEGRKMVEAARKYRRIVQVGTQSRSSGGWRDAVARLHAGEIGKLYMARGLCYKPRHSIGFKPNEAPPKELAYGLWLGPAPEQPYNANLVHYNWHWFWDFGNGDMGNQGVHQMDIARWGLGKGLPVKITAAGGRFGYVDVKNLDGNLVDRDQGETPNTEICAFTYDDGTLLVFETRGRYTNDEDGVKVGDLFYGSEGYMADTAVKFGFGGKPYRGRPKEQVELAPVGGSGKGNHFQNWIDAVRSRRVEDLNADVLEGHLSAALCHLGNIAYRLGRTLVFDPKTETFPGDAEANKLLKRDYRRPFVIPENV